MKVAMSICSDVRTVLQTPRIRVSNKKRVFKVTLKKLKDMTKDMQTPQI